MKHLTGEPTIDLYPDQLIMQPGTVVKTRISLPVVILQKGKICEYTRSYYREEKTPYHFGVMVKQSNELVRSL